MKFKNIVWFIKAISYYVLLRSLTNKLTIKFVTGVKIKTKSESKLNDSPAVTHFEGVIGGQ